MRAALFLRLKRTAPSWITKAKRNNEKIKTLTAVRGSKSLTKLKSILQSLLIENLQAGIRRALLMFAVLIRLCAGFRVTLARLQKAHKTNLGPPAPQAPSPPPFPLLFFRNYALTLSPTLKFHDLGTARPLQNKSAGVVNRRMNQLISSVKKLLKRKPSETLGHTQRVSSLDHTFVSLFCA